MTQENRKTRKTKNSTIAIDLNTSNRLDIFCKSKNITKKDFITLSLDYFDRTGVDIHSNDIVNNMNAINEKMDSILRLQADSALKLTGLQQTTSILTLVKDDTTKLINQKENAKKGFWNRFKKNK